MTPPKKNKKGKAVSEKDSQERSSENLALTDLTPEELIQRIKNKVNDTKPSDPQTESPQEHVAGPMDLIDQYFTRARFVITALQIEQSKGRESDDWIEHVGNRSESEMNAEYEWLNKLMKDVKTFKDIRDKESGK